MIPQLHPVVPVPPERFRGILPIDAEVDQFVAALSLFALDCGLIDADEFVALRDDWCGLFEQIEARLNRRLDAVARPILGDLVSDDDRFDLFHLGIPDDGLLENDVPCLSLSMINAYQINIDLEALPDPLGEAVSMALLLLQRFYPLTLGVDFRGYGMLSDEIFNVVDQMRAAGVDLTRLDVAELDRLLTLESGFREELEELLSYEGSEVLVERLIAFSEPVPASYQRIASRLRGVDFDHSLRLLRGYIRQFESQPRPSLCEHPLARWVATCWSVMAQWDVSCLEAKPLSYREHLGFETALDGVVQVGLGTSWEQTLMDEHLDMLSQIGEPIQSLLLLDGVANPQAHERLLVLAEGTALLVVLLHLIEENHVQ